MRHAIPLDGPIDLPALDAFLASDRAPPECMRLAELDGFLAGLVVTAEPIPPSEWLPVVWHGDEPEFADAEQAAAIIGTIFRRYNQIIGQLDNAPMTYRPVIGPDDAEGHRTSDWAFGFIEAISLSPNAWLPLLGDRLAGVLLDPIIQIASTTDRANLALDAGERLPAAELAKLVADAAKILAVCVTGMRAFFRKRPRKVAGKVKRRTRGRAA